VPVDETEGAVWLYTVRGMFRRLTASSVAWFPSRLPSDTIELDRRECNRGLRRL
jgi:hypothetical protein